MLAFTLKNQKSKSYITQLKDDTSKVITDKNDIAETFATYYEKLYKDETD